ncbi:MAG: hypothetical protein HY926_04055 [Elusimicrobia bacterium]|nr:hypothetical protein [Elusimicrobiota bacterium]
MNRNRLACSLFFLSGFAALVYETVWTRQLVLVFGATLTSASTVLAGFMAGMALGALWGMRARRGAEDPLRLYGKLELAIAAYAAAFPWVVKAVMGFVETTALPAAPVRFVLIFAALLPATTLMGATFPVLSRLGSGSDPGRRVGTLYAANLVGSSLGVLAAAFLLLPFLGLLGSHRLAVLISLAVGAVAVGAKAEPPPDPARPPAAAAVPFGASAGLFVAGLCGMAFEVVWIRILTPSFNNSAYGFAAVIFVFLAGLGGGSFAAARAPAPGLAGLGAVQILAALFAYVGYRAFEITQLVQIRLGTMGASGISPVVFAPLLEALAVLLPLALFQGMLLPTALRAADCGGDAGAAAGRLYFWNTAGGILGALAAGFWWIPAAGVQNALLLAISASAACGAALVAAAAPRRALRLGAPAAVLALLVLMGLSLRGRNLPQAVLLDWLNRGDLESSLPFYADDTEASVAVRDSGGRRSLVINGVGVTGFNMATKMLAHIPLLLHPGAERTLIICFGMGTTFRSALRHEGQVEAVDLVPSVFQAFPFFYPDAARRLGDPRAAHFVDDGRNHMLRSRGGYDVILVDPSPPLYAAGTVNLYSRDFFALARRRLRPGGILAVLLPEYPETDFKMVMKSFISAFPHSQMWFGSPRKKGLIMLGGERPLPEDRALVRRRLRDAGLREDLREVSETKLGEAAFWDLRLGLGGNFRDYLSGSPEVTDEFPRLEYPYFRSKTRAYYKHPAILGGAQ